MKSQSVRGSVCSKCFGVYMERDHTTPGMAEVEQCRSVAATERVIDRRGAVRDDPRRGSAPPPRIPMNKVAIAAAALLVIVLLAMPGVVGSITEARVRERVAAIDASPSAAAELTSFDRGWFRSTARIELELRPTTSHQLADAAGTPLGVVRRVADRRRVRARARRGARRRVLRLVEDGRPARRRGAGRRRAHADARRSVSVRVSRPHAPISAGSTSTPTRRRSRCRSTRRC